MKNFVDFIVLLSFQLIGSYCSPRTVYLERNCGGIIDLSQEPKGSFKLGLTPNAVYAPYTDCHVTVVTNQNMQIGITFLDMNIMSFMTCQSDYLQIYDGVKINNSTFLYTTSHDHKRLCGRNLPPHFASQHSNVTLRFVSDADFSSKGFLLLLTSFHKGSCRDDEYKCSNSRCIHEDLHCDEYNNCGDSSDICHFSIYIIIGVVLTSVILIIALVFLCSVLHYRFRKRLASDEDDFDTVSVGTEYSEIEQTVPARVSTTGTSTWFPGMSASNIMSIITRTSIDNNDSTGHSYNREPPEYCSASRSIWLNNQLVF